MKPLWCAWVGTAIPMYACVCLRTSPRPTPPFINAPDPASWSKKKSTTWNGQTYSILVRERERERARFR